MLKKLNERDITNLQKSITKSELLLALNRLKDNKSSGLDGVSSKLLKKIVVLAPSTFLDAFNECYLNGVQLDKSLKTAYIRLISKGGDPTILKNWRPITIISSINKLFCKIIYSRIERIVDQLLGPTQCAYRKSKDISDVVLNLNEYIAGIRERKYKKILMSLDFSAAFDSLNHDFILEVLRHFNFPPQFIRVIKNYLEDNLSCVIMEDNSFTKFFKIGKGTGQGNPLSCLIFILVIEILLIKLNHSPSLQPLNLTLFNRVSLESRALGFADDLNCLINDNEQDILSLKNILDVFGGMSNLKLNEKKTKIIPLGFDIERRAELKTCISSLGFQICTRDFKILGYVICITDELNCQKNWALALKKCYGIASKLMSLSLNTRSKVNIIKTFMLSQICYIARCYKPSNEIISRLEDMISSFLNYGRDNFARNNIFKPQDDFGLGIPSLESFCMSLLQKNTSRATSSDQPWAIILKSNFLFESLDKLRTGAIGSCYMNALVDATVDLANRYYSQYNNEVPFFYTQYIINNVDPLIFRGQPPKPSDDVAMSIDRISNIKLKDLFDNSKCVKSKQSMQDLLGFQISFNSYLRLRGAAMQCPSIKLTNKKSCKSFSFFLKSLRNSKHLRDELYPYQSSKCNTVSYYEKKLNIPSNVIKLTELDRVGRRVYIPERLKHFAFNFVRNRLHLGAQLRHFTTVDGDCIACKKTSNISIPETTSHVFFCCNFNKNLIKETLSFYFSDYEFENDPLCVLKGIFVEKNKKLNSLIMLAALCIFYTIFSFSMRKKLCTMSACKMAVANIIKKCLASDRKLEAFVCHEVTLDKFINLKNELCKLH